MQASKSFVWRREWLYEKTGFKRRGPFADYRPDLLSVFMERPVNLP
jgi:hypothetical protein